MQGESADGGRSAFLFARDQAKGFAVPEDFEVLEGPVFPADGGVGDDDGGAGEVEEDDGVFEAGFPAPFFFVACVDVGLVFLESDRNEERSAEAMEFGDRAPEDFDVPGGAFGLELQPAVKA